MSRSPSFTQAQVRRGIREAQKLALAEGFVVTGYNVTTGEAERRPMTAAELEDAHPIVTADEAASLCLCSSVDQFRLLVKEGVFPKGINNQKWDKRQLRVALKKARVEPDTVAFSEIYFLEVGDFIKIGYSTGVYTRIATMQVGSPYEIVLLGTIRGSIRNEEEVHQRFAHLRHRGEWFKKTKGLLAYIDWAKANGAP